MRNAKDAQLDDAEHDDEHAFNALHSVRLTVLSRLVESLRFTSGPRHLATQVTLESLLSAFEEHCTLVELDLSQREAVHDRVQRIWHTLDTRCCAPLKEEITFAFLFNFELAAFPETTAECREKLRGLGESQELISRMHVCESLGCEADDQVVEFIFATGVAVLPSEVFLEIVDSLNKHPTTVQFAPRFVAMMAERGKRMQPFWLYLAVFVAITIAVPRIASQDHFAVHENAYHFADNDFETGCPAGAAVAWSAVAPGTCSLLHKRFSSISKPEIDVMQYVRRQIILDLWPKTEPISINPAQPPIATSLGNFRPSGALVIRMANQTSAFAMRDDHGCDSMRLQRRAPHFEVNGYYECNAEWAVIIPFNVSRDAALELARQQVPDLPVQSQAQHTAIIIQFVGLVPSASVVAHSQLILSLPRGGGVIPRAHISVLDPSAATHLLPVLILKIAGTVWELGWVVVFAIAGIPWYDDWALYADIATTVLGTAAFVALQAVDFPLVAELAQGSKMPHDVDRLVDAYNAGMSLTGFFFTLCILCLLRFARDIRGLDFLYAILRTAMIEILATVGIFIVWCFGFVAVGMLLLGDTVEQFSSVRLCWQTLMLFFFKSDDLVATTENSPVIGTMFYFAYMLFVIFFALNVLIAIITAPLTLIRGQRNATEHALDVVAAKWQLTERKYRFLANRYLLWPLANVLMCSIPLFKHRWFQLQRAMHVFYQCGRKPPSVLDRVANAERVVHLAFGAQRPHAHTSGSSSERNPLGGQSTELRHRGDDPRSAGTETSRHLHDPSAAPAHEQMLQAHGWDSPLVRLVISEALIFPDSTLALVLAAIAAETSVTLVRDARLVLALRHFADFDADSRKVVRLQESLVQACVQQQEAVAQVLVGVNVKMPGQFSRRQSMLSRTSTLSKLPREASARNNGQEDNANSDCAKATYFLGIVDARISNSNQFLFYAATTLLFTLYYFVPFFTNEEHTAWLTRSLHSQLRFGDIVPDGCSTDSTNGNSTGGLWCTPDAITFNKTFESTGDMREFQLWLRHGLLNFLWYRSLHDLPGGEQGSLWFDSRIRLSGPLRFRQLRARAASCAPFVSAVAEALNVSRGTEGPSHPQRCFTRASDNDPFDTTFHPDVSLLGSPPREWRTLPMNQTVFSSVCGDAVPHTFWGHFGDYPCSGFTVAVDGPGQLVNLLESGWFDARTLFVSVTGDFEYDNETAVRYTMLAEFAENQGSCKPRVFASLLRSSADLRTLTDRLVIVYLVVGAHALWFAVLWLRYWHRRYVVQQAVEECIFLRPEVPVHTLLMLLWLVVGTNVVFPDTSDPNRELAVGLSSVLYIMITFSTQNVFPAASLVSKEVLTLVTTLFKAVMQVFYVLPFFLTFMTAFAFGGCVAFGRFVPQFSSTRWSFLQLSVITFSRFDMQVMQRGRPQEAQIFAVVILFTILITLNNVFLAIVTSACGEAQFTAANVGVAELLLRRFRKHVIYGRFVGFVLTLMQFAAVSEGDMEEEEEEGGSKSHSGVHGNRTTSGSTRGWSVGAHDALRRVAVRLVQIFLPRLLWEPRAAEVAQCVGQGRLWFPVESVLTTLPPLRANQLLRHMHHRQASNVAFAAMLPFVLGAHNEYRIAHPQRAADDDVLNARMELTVASEIRASRPAFPDELHFGQKPTLSMIFGSGIFSSPCPPPEAREEDAPSAPTIVVNGERSGSFAGAHGPQRGRVAPLQAEHFLSLGPSDEDPPPPRVAVNDDGRCSDAAAPGERPLVVSQPASTLSSAGVRTTEAGWAVFKRQCREAGVALSTDLWQRLKDGNMDDATKLTVMEVFDEFFAALAMSKQQSTFLTGGSHMSGANFSDGSNLSDASHGKKKRGQGRRTRSSKVTFGNVLV